LGATGSTRTAALVTHFSEGNFQFTFVESLVTIGIEAFYESAGHLCGITFGAFRALTALRTTLPLIGAITHLWAFRAICPGSLHGASQLRCIQGATFICIMLGDPVLGDLSRIRALWALWALAFLGSDCREAECG
jgi:hypothetical protein